MTSYFLHIYPHIWEEFRQALLKVNSTNQEVIGFLICQGKLISENQVRYTIKDWIVPSADCYEYQSSHRLVLKQEFHIYLLKNYLWDTDYDIVHIHTHNHIGVPHFSEIDNHYESEYAEFLSSQFTNQPRLISGVFNQDLTQGQFRIWNFRGTSFESLDYNISWFKGNSYLQQQNDPNNLMFVRQQVFGKLFQQKLGQLRVSLIGCGGIGAIFAEVLGRLGVNNWVLVDPDYLDTVNLNRMPGATPMMVAENWSKVKYVQSLIEHIYEKNCKVKAIANFLEDSITTHEIIDTDLIVVATDNHYTRQIAQQLALEYQLPLLSLGTHLEIQENQTPRLYCRITIPPVNGGWCLMCGNIISLQQAALELSPQRVSETVSQSGYLPDVSDPAVFWLNSICSSTAVGIIQGILSGFIDITNGLDWIYQFPCCQWLKTDVSHLVTPDCYFCS